MQVSSLPALLAGQVRRLEPAFLSPSTGNPWKFWEGTLGPLGQVSMCLEGRTEQRAGKLCLCILGQNCPADR